MAICWPVSLNWTTHAIGKPDERAPNYLFFPPPFVRGWNSFSWFTVMRCCSSWLVGGGRSSKNRSTLLDRNWLTTQSTAMSTVWWLKSLCTAGCWPYTTKGPVLVFWFFAQENKQDVKRGNMYTVFLKRGSVESISEWGDYREDWPRATHTSRESVSLLCGTCHRSNTTVREEK